MLSFWKKKNPTLIGHRLSFFNQKNWLWKKKKLSNLKQYIFETLFKISLISGVAVSEVTRASLFSKNSISICQASDSTDIKVSSDTVSLWPHWHQVPQPLGPPLLQGQQLDPISVVIEALLWSSSQQTTYPQQAAGLYFPMIIGSSIQCPPRVLCLWLSEPFWLCFLH